MIVLLCLLAAGLGALAGGLWFRRREKRTLEALDRMLDRAAQGAAIQGPLDEGLLSAVETRLGEYLESVGTASQALQEEKDRVKTLVSDIGHQTRTPVANLLLYTQLLGEEDLSGQGKVCVQALEAQAEKLRTLMEALVKTSRLETGMLALCPTPNPVGPMLEEAVAQFAPGAAEKGLTLTLEPTGAAARFDPKWTGEAVCNLLDNGVKYTPAGGRITVSVTLYDLFCRIDVADTGPGLAEEEQAKVFQRFSRWWASPCTWCGRSPPARAGMCGWIPPRGRGAPSLSFYPGRRGDHAKLRWAGRGCFRQLVPLGPAQGGPCNVGSRPVPGGDPGFL